MTNYVAIYHFSNPATASDLSKQLEKQYPQNISESSNGLPYFAFGAREEPGVVDNLRHMVNESQIAKDDFIALYFTSDENSDQIKRVMVLGSDMAADEQVKQISAVEHNNKLIDLLEAEEIRKG